MAGVAPVAMDASLLFNLFINEIVLFLKETMLRNYTDNNNQFSIGKDINKVKDTLAKIFEIITYWFYKDFMVLKSKKRHFMCISRDTENEAFTFKDVL